MNVTNLAVVELLQELRTAENLASKEKLTASEERQYTNSLAKISLLKQGVSSQEISRAKVEQLRSELGLPIDMRIPQDSELRSAWSAFVRQAETRTDYQATSEWGNVTGLSWTTAAGDKGAAFVPPAYDERLFASLAAVDGIVESGNSNVVETVSGAAMTTPSVDDVAGSPVSAVRSVLVSEATQGAVQGVRATKVAWGACPTYRSGIVYVATELDQDSCFAMLSLLEEVFNRRHALAFGADMISGSGVEAIGGTSGVPLGLTTNLPASTNITSVNTVSGNFIDDLISLYKTLPRQYRRGAKFYMSSGTLLDVARQLESATRSKGDANGFDTLFGREIVTCDSMQDAAAGVQNAIVFAHPDYILQRRVKNGALIRRFTESQGAIEAGLVGFQGFFRADARPMLLDSVQAPYASLNIKS
ncbi:MAG TPA: phage major capsid protein [Candidatus Udaeobacter sp.]|nr:phage major capsid protein [Candidatus Udaeobacter sp.]